MKSFLCWLLPWHVWKPTGRRSYVPREFVCSWCKTRWAVSFDPTTMGYPILAEEFERHFGKDRWFPAAPVESVKPQEKR